MWQNIIFVGLGSIVGGVSRYFISEWSRHLFPSSFPWGTFIVNIAGCFLLGLLSGFFTSHPAPVYRLFFTVGFCGSIFSNNILNSFNRIQDAADRTVMVQCINNKCDIFAHVTVDIIWTA